MDQKIILYRYTETIAELPSAGGNWPAVLTDLCPEYTSSSQRIFSECGGLKIRDYFQGPTIHVRVSFWKDREGYEQWYHNRTTANYLKARAEYQQANRIVGCLEGPFEGGLDE